ncbi:hypothetical protein C6P42_000729, partial [Pichia californica]
FTTSDNFLNPISVKSKQWGNKKVDIQNIKMQQGPFSKYSTNHIIEPPTNALDILPSENDLTQSIYKQTIKTDSIQSDEVDNLRTRDLILDLLKPKDYPKELVNPNDKIVPGLNTELYDHQVFGLRFLKKRESVKRISREYINEVYGPQHDNNNDKDKTLFNLGGILADDMGLGKTVQILSLILQNQNKKKTKTLKDKTTLIVCPASLICQWCSEIEKKTPSLTVLSFHGTKRPTETSIIFKYDVIVTSYQTLSSEFAKLYSPLFDKEYPFRRVVLDEAHIIKNQDTKAHESCCNIIAIRRWCLTGTPIQNKIDELYSLFKFLSVNQYEDNQIWRIKISNLLSSKNPNDSPKALKRLHNLLDKYMLRRTKEVIIENNVLTVRKIIHTEILDFTPFERTIYDKLKEKIINSILGSNIINNDGDNDDNDNDDDDNDEDNNNNDRVLNNNTNIKLDYMSGLTYLLRLRQVCCHWELLFNFSQKSDDDLLTVEISEALNLKKNKESNEELKKKIDEELFDEELHEILDSMKNMHIDKTKIKIKNESISRINESLHAIKIQRILNILKNDNPIKPRKTIIFSEFTSMLKILEKNLIDNKIRFVRYDGSMDKQAKDEVLNSLDENPLIHVLLCSLKCGAYGLNITSCSRVILYEPFWNPAIGSQAIDRAYRIGQLNDVDVHELYIADSIEMRIKELQDKKRNLMMAVVDKDVKSAVKLIGNGLNKSELFTLLGIDIKYIKG